MVSFLLENGALDNFTQGNGINNLASGLYLATLNGHVEVVKLLLSKQSRIDVAFNGNNVLHAFIPKLFFELETKLRAMSSEKFTNILESIKLILNRLQFERPSHLDFQLQVPVAEGINCLAWFSKNPSLDSDKESQQRVKKLEQLLMSFGADKDAVFSFDDLRKKSCNIGEEYTLYVANTLK